MYIAIAMPKIYSNSSSKSHDFKKAVFQNEMVISI